MQLQESDLFSECIILRDGLMVLSDCFKANDINAVIDYLCCDGSPSNYMDLALIYWL